MPSCTSRRLAHTQVWPVLRYLLAIAPCTAASRSASSNTMKGALPPSSSDTFLIVAAHCAISFLPTSVEPVKVSLRTIGLEVISPPISLARPGDHVQHALRDAGALCKLRHRERRVRRLRRGFAHDRASRCQRRAGLARDHRRREIPRRDRRDYADRLAQHQDALVRLVTRDHIAVEALAFFCEPFDERGGVRDFAPALPREACPARLSSARRDHPGSPSSGRASVAGLRHVPLRSCAPRPGMPPCGGLDRAARLSGPHVGHGAELLLSGWIDDVDGGAAAGVRPCCRRYSTADERACCP